MSCITTRVAVLGLVLTVGTASPVNAADSTATLADLSWLAGCWIHESKGVRSEECWMEPAGTLMPGLHRDVRPNGKTFFEYLRIEKTDSAIVYFATPSGKETTLFPLLKSTKNHVVFENPMHDFPQRIIYELRADGTLRAAIEGLQDGEMRSEEWVWHKGSITSK